MRQLDPSVTFTAVPAEHLARLELAALELLWDPWCAGLAAVALRFLPRTASLPCPLVVTFHGAQPLFRSLLASLPDTETRLAFVEQALEGFTFWREQQARVSHFLSPSRHAFHELCGVVPGAHHRTTIAPHGSTNPQLFADPTAREGVGFLHVSCWQPVKNISVLLEAWRRLPDESRPPLTLVCPELPEKVWKPYRDTAGLTVVCTPLSHRELGPLYRGALAFVFPSLRETFGMPVAEAMACGCPVITSRAAALAELYAEAALLVPPGSVDALREAMQKVIDDTNLRDRLRNAGQTRARELSWARSAERHLEAFRHAMQSHRTPSRPESGPGVEADVSCAAPPAQPAARLDNEALLVLGMHRSGTSATTGTLHALGIDLGTHLLPPGLDNPRGYFEHAAITALHEELLHELDWPWYDPSPPAIDWDADPRVARARERLQALLLQEFGSTFLWALKDPRLCRLLPLWTPVLDRLGVRPRALLVVRDPREVAASLAARNGFDRTHSHALWLSYVLASLEHTRPLARATLVYEDLLAAPHDTLASVAERCGLSLPLLEDRQAAHDRICSILDPALRHHRVPRAATACEWEELSVSLYESVRQTAPCVPDDIPAHIRETWRDRFAAAATFLAARNLWVQELHDRHAAEIAQRERHARALQQRIEAMERSRSWRITAPLRWIVGRMRALRGA